MDHREQIITGKPLTTRPVSDADKSAQNLNLMLSIVKALNFVQLTAF